MIVTNGAVISILATVAVVAHVFPAASLKVNMNEPLPVKVYQVAPPLLVTVIASDQLTVATTLPLVAPVVE